MKIFKPLKRVREKCLDCSGQSRKDVKECKFEDCPFYSLRMGRGGRASLKKMRSYCLWCCNGQKGEVRACPSVKCPIWEYRFGRRPVKSPLSPENLTTEGVLETIEA